MGLFTRDEPRMTHDEWIKWLHENPLTLKEFHALEIVHVEMRLENIQKILEGVRDEDLSDIRAGLGVHPERRGGYLEQIKSIIDGLLKRAISQQNQKRQGAIPDGEQPGPRPLRSRAEGA